MRLSSDDGWMPWGLLMNGDPDIWMAPYNRLLLIAREEWDQPVIARREDLNPYTNCIGLCWKLTGIARTQEK